ADGNPPDNAIVNSGVADAASAVGVANEDNGAADPAYRCFHQGNVLCRCVEAVLRCNTLITLHLKGNDQLVETRTIRPKSMGEHNTWFCFHTYVLRFLISCSGVQPAAALSKASTFSSKSVATLRASDLLYG